MRERLCRLVVRILTPYCRLESKQYTKSLNKSIEDKKRDLVSKEEYIIKLEQALESKYHIPMNFDYAVQQINNLSPGARATFLFRLIDKADDDTLDTINRYVHLRNKESNI